MVAVLGELLNEETTRKQEFAIEDSGRYINRLSTMSHIPRSVTIAANTSLNYRASRENSNHVKPRGKVGNSPPKAAAEPSQGEDTASKIDDENSKKRKLDDEMECESYDSGFTSLYDSGLGSCGLPQMVIPGTTNNNFSDVLQPGITDDVAISRCASNSTKNVPNGTDIGQPKSGYGLTGNPFHSAKTHIGEIPNGLPHSPLPEIKQRDTNEEKNIDKSSSQAMTERMSQCKIDSCSKNNCMRETQLPSSGEEQGSQSLYLPTKMTSSFEHKEEIPNLANGPKKSSSVPHLKRLSPGLDHCGLMEGRVDMDDSRTQSLPPMQTSSYLTTNPKRLPPKKRRLHYEQDLESDSINVDRQLTPDQPRKIKSLPNNFRSAPSVDHQVPSFQMPVPAQPAMPSYGQFIAPNGQVMIMPFMALPPQYAFMQNMVGFAPQIPTGALIPPIHPSAVQDLSREMAALNANEQESLTHHSLPQPNCSSLPKASAGNAALSMPIIYEHSRLQNARQDRQNVQRLEVQHDPLNLSCNRTNSVSNSADLIPRSVPGTAFPTPQANGSTRVPEFSATMAASPHSCAKSPSPKPDKKEKLKKRSGKTGPRKSPSPNITPATQETRTVHTNYDPPTAPISPPPVNRDQLVSPSHRVSSPAPTSNGHNNDQSGESNEAMERRMAIEADEDGDVPLHIAVVQNEASAVRCLIKVMTSANFTIDYLNNLKQTPLHLAVITKLEPILQLLLEGGASPNVQDRKGQTCVHLAVNNRTVACLKTLLVHSKVTPDLNAKNYEGLTPLHRAVQIGNRECLQILLEHGADINMVDGKSGKSPLYLAFECNQPQVADLLLARGADVSIPTYSGSTVLQAANTRGQHLLTNFIGRGNDANNSTRELQNKLNAKVNRNRNKHVSQGVLKHAQNGTKDIISNKYMPPRPFHTNGVNEKFKENSNGFGGNNNAPRINDFSIQQGNHFISPPMET